MKFTKNRERGAGFDRGDGQVSGGLDQSTPYGTVFTRTAPAARLSKTPSYSERGPAVIGAHDPLLTGWDTKVTIDGVPKHRPSEMVKRGLLGFLEGYGHEDIMLRKS
jgi:hypothetical protein